MEPTRKQQPTGFARLQAELDQVFLELWRGERVSRGGKAAFRPNTDVYYDTRKNALVIKLELAGVDPKEVDLEVEENILRIAGSRKDQRHPDAIYQQMEIAYGQFERLVLLPSDVDVSKASATYAEGFLEIELPLRPRASAKRIPIVVKDEPTAPDREEDSSASQTK